MARASLVSVVGNLATPVTAIVFAPLLARALGVAERGELAGATAPLLLGAAALTLGLPEALTYVTARARLFDARMVGRSAAILGVVGIVAGVLLGLLIAPELDTREAQVACWLSLAMLPGCLVVAGIRGAAMGLHLWTRVAQERVITAVTRLVAIVVLFACGQLDVLTGAATIGPTMLLGTIAYRGAFREAHGSAYPRAARPTSRLLGFGLRYWSGTLAGTILSRLDQVLMVPLTSSTELGVYAIAVSIAEISLVLNMSLRDIMFAVESHEQDPVRVAAFSRISTVLTTGLCLGIGAASWVLVSPVFGAEFDGARPVIALLLVATVIGNPGSICGAGLSGWGRPELRSTSIAIAAAVNVALTLVLVPDHGAIGAAVATIAGSALAGNLNIWFCKRYFDVPMRDFYGVRRSDARALVDLTSRVAKQLAR